MTAPDSAHNAEDVRPVRWWKARFAGSTRLWFGADRRCRKWQLGPFHTDWRCLLIHDHAKVEGFPHIYEPDIWPGGRYHDEWAFRGGLETGRPPASIDGSGDG
jgi:hypothetical protein